MRRRVRARYRPAGQDRGGRLVVLRRSLPRYSGMADASSDGGAGLVRTSAMRWPIETCFETGKQELGMGDYEVRSWRGWHHHMTLVILALAFLVRVQDRLKNAPALTLPQAQFLVAHVIPRRTFDAQ